MVAKARIGVRWVNSWIGCDRAQRNTIRGLGLKRLGQRVELEDTPAIRGMLRKVAHLVSLEEA